MVPEGSGRTLYLGFGRQLEVYEDGAVILKYDFGRVPNDLAIDVLFGAEYCTRKTAILRTSDKLEERVKQRYRTTGFEDILTREARRVRFKKTWWGGIVRTGKGDTVRLSDSNFFRVITQVSPSREKIL